MAPTTAANGARKGDLVLVERKSRHFHIGEGTRESVDYSFGVVASATREGAVKTWRSVGWGDDLISPSAQALGYARCWVLPAKGIDVEAVLRAAKAHHWPNHPGQPMAFPSLDEARNAARPFRRDAAKPTAA